MAIKDANVENDVNSAADEPSWVSPDVVQTAADGTVSVVEFEATENPDGSGDPASHMTYTETAPDGTETVKEAVITADAVYLVEQDSMLENAIESALGVEFDNDLVEIDPKTGLPIEEAETTETFQAESDTLESNADFQTSDTYFNVGDENFAGGNPVGYEEVVETETTFATPAFETEPDYSASFVEDSALDPTFAASGDSTFETVNPTYAVSEVADNSLTTSATDTTSADAEAAAELADQATHSQAATDAQAAADEFIAKGDYAAAAEAREVAEAESWEAGDDSMLSAYDAGDLSYAAEKQEEAEYYNAQEAEYAQAGDYEAAREAASNSAYATGNADLYAGGDDHTGQADSEYTNMDNAVWQEGLRDDQLDNAAWNAEMGNTDAAQSSLDSAAQYQENADYYGDLGEHGGDNAYYDPSSEVATGGSYESTYDASTTAVDTSYDSGMDTSYDMSTDTSYDSGMDDV